MGVNRSGGVGVRFVGELWVSSWIGVLEFLGTDGDRL